MIALSDIALAALPCIGQSSLYDLVLFDDDAPTQQRDAARTKAAGLCAGCPSPCPEKVTTDTTPRALTLLPSGWMPPEREGKPEPEVPTFGKPRRRQPGMDHKPGSDYVRPNQRVAEWARMAVGLAARGRTTADIAEALCISEDTAAALLDLARQPHNTTGRAA